MAAWAVKQSLHGRSLLFEFDGRKARGGTKGRSRTTLVHGVGAMHVLASVRAASPRKPISRTEQTHNFRLTPASKQPIVDIPCACYSQSRLRGSYCCVDQVHPQVVSSFFNPENRL
jgi:hypothetical protein